MASENQLIEAIKKRKCILFLGAGAHYPPPSHLKKYQYPEEKRPPLGANLAKILADKCHQDICTTERRSEARWKRIMDEGDRDGEWKQHHAEKTKKLRFIEENGANLQRISWFYEWIFGRNSLVNQVSSAVDDGKSPSSIIKALAELDFPIVITTNYDTIFENTLEPFVRTISKHVYDPNETSKTAVLRGNPKSNECWIYKIHGCVTKRKSLVVTDEDYIKFVRRMATVREKYHPIPQRIRVLLTKWPILFVGYSLLDYNLRLLFNALRWTLDPAERPATYSVDLYPDLLIKATYGAGSEGMEPRVKFFVEDMWSFIPRLYLDCFERDMPS